MHGLLADLIVIVHLSFIIFVTLGGILVLYRRKVMWVHIPLALWGIIVEYFNILCPLTPLENYFRYKAGRETYEGDFVGNYILPLIYPEGLTRTTQILLGSFVILLNVLIYGYIFVRYRRKQKQIEG